MKWKNAFYSCYLGSLVIVAHFFSLFSVTHAGCTFPKKWFGEWFQSDILYGHIVINETFFGSKGSCVETVGSDQFIIESKEKNLYQCLLINLQHDNVIQYKETFANTPEPEKSLASLCGDLSPDLTLYSMFRVNAKPISCPFVNPPFTFYYSRGEATCQYPASTINACADNTKLLLHYSACTDVKGSESTTEELTCVGVWKSGNSNYLVAKAHDNNERNPFEAEKYKCYLYETVGQGSVNTGYRIAQTEASCSGLSSINDGSTVMTLAREEVRHTNCKFPSWITGQKTWRALNSGVEYNFASSNATKLAPSGEETVICHSIESSEDMKYSYIVVKVMSGCKVGYKCVLFQRRDAHIIEMQEALSTEESYPDVCSASKFEPAAVPLVTYVTANFPPRKCPPLPRLISVPENRLCKDTYHQVSIGCGGKPEKVEFKPPEACSNASAVGAHLEFMCHGHWEAKKVNSSEAVGYIISTPLKTGDNKYICFSYTKKNDVYQLRATAPTCYEPRAMFTFQLKSGGECRSEDSGKNYAEDADSNSDSKCATLAISAFHFFIAYLLSVWVR